MATLQKAKNIEGYIFVISLTMLILREYLNSFFWDYEISSSIISYLIYIPTVILGLQFILNKYHKKKEIYILTVLTIVYIVTKEGNILILALMAMSVINIEDRYIIKAYFNVHIILFITTITLALLYPHLISHGGYHYKLKEGIMTLRGTFGLPNPNATFYYLMPIYASYIYIKFDKYNNLDRVLLITITLLVYCVTSSRTGVIAIVGSLIFIDVIKFIDLNKYNAITKYIKYVPLIFTTISVLIGTVFYESKLMNSLLSSRPKYWHVYLIEKGSILKLFGNRYSQNIRNNNPMDSSYIYILCFLGIIAFVLLMYIMYRMLDKYVKENQKKYIAIIMMFLVYGLAENILLKVSFNFTLLLMIKHFINLDITKKINIYSILNRNHR